MDENDAQLIAKYLKKRDEQALEVVVQRYLPLVYGYVRNFTGNQDNAADIAQEVFVKAWKNLKRYDQKKSFKTWLFTIAKRTSIDWLRRKEATPFSTVDALLGTDWQETIADGALSIHEQLIAGQMGQQLAVAQENLPALTKQIITLHIAEGRTFQEIARKVGKPLNTIKSSYRRGLLQLQRLISRDN